MIPSRPSDRAIQDQETRSSCAQCKIVAHERYRLRVPGVFQKGQFRGTPSEGGYNRKSRRIGDLFYGRNGFGLRNDSAPSRSQ
ncbi:MAG: hypothetical protein D6741_13945 [Planctomycetota bacterium]|nr:MAG: hypothetical protein D6741_13945 [Planctomycetota bacterium]